MLSPLPLLLLLLCDVTRAQEISVQTEVLDGDVARTTVQIDFNNDADSAQRANFTLTLPETTAPVSFQHPRISTDLAFPIEEDPTSVCWAVAAAEDANHGQRIFNSPDVIAFVSRTCDRCVVVHVNVPAWNILTVRIVYNETLYGPEVCAPGLRLHLPKGPVFKNDTVAYSVSVSGKLLQPNMEAEICDFKNSLDDCSCSLAPSQPSVDATSATFELNLLTHDTVAGLRVCTTYQQDDKDSVGVATSAADLAARSRRQYVVFLLDTGDTVSDRNLVKIKEIFVNETRSLKETDSFSVVSYANRTKVWTQEDKDIFAGVQSNVDEAIRYVEALTKDAGSSLVSGMSRALELVQNAKQANQVCGGRASVVVITGWTPKGGDAEVRRAVRWLTNLNQRALAAIFVVGVGETVNTCALQELAAANRGMATRVRVLQPLTSLVQQARNPQQLPASIPQYVEPTIYNLTVNSRVEMRYAVTVITSKVYNGANYKQEAVFSAVIPDRAFVSSFTIEDESKVYHSEVVERGNRSAATISGKHSARVDTSARHSNVILLSLNMAPHAEYIFTLTYEELLEKENGFYTLRLNLDPRQIVENLLVAVRVKDTTPITSLKYQRPTSTSEHEVDFGPYLPKNDFEINWRPNGWEQERMLREGSRKLEVRFQLDQSSPQQIILTPDAYFVHFFSPVGLDHIKKYVVFTLDVSGSMTGRKITQSKEAFSAILDDLRPTDTFSLIQFETHVKVWSGGKNCKDPAQTSSPKVATIDDLLDAKRCVSRMQAGGVTNFNDALVHSVASAKKQLALGVEAIIIALTDGLPSTVGKEDILRRYRGGAGGGVMHFCLALGEDADYPFLRELSTMTGAFARKIYVAEDTAPQLRNFFNVIVNVVLSNVNFTYQGLNAATKTTFRVFIDGTDLVVAGKMAPEQVTFASIVNTTQGPLINLEPPKIVQSDFDKADRLQAFLLVKQLLHEDRDTAVATALKYKFLTPLTSLVVHKPGCPITLDITPVVVVESEETPMPTLPSSQKKVCDNYEATNASADVVNVPFNSGYTLSDITWSSGDLKVLSQPANDSNAAFGPCWTSELETGNCRHLLHCVLPDFTNNRARFEADRCHLSDEYVGVCCPHYLQPSVLGQ